MHYCLVEALKSLMLSINKIKTLIKMAYNVKLTLKCVLVISEQKLVLHFIGEEVLHDKQRLKNTTRAGSK